MKYKKKYTFPMAVLCLIAFLFYGKAVAGKNSFQVPGGEPGFRTGGYTSWKLNNGLSEKDRKRVKDEIKAVLEKEKYLEKELSKELYLLQNQMAEKRFNAHEVESISRQVYTLEMEFYRNLSALLDKIRTGQASASSGFIGRGPVFEQTSFVEPYYIH